MANLFCSRPHVNTVNFRTARFVVGKASGLDIDGRHLVRGDEVSMIGMTEYAARCIYEPPLRLIERLDYALTIPDLREACFRQGITDEKEKEEVKPPILNLESLSHNELIAECKKNGLSHAGNAKQLRNRLKSFLGD